MPTNEGNMKNIILNSAGGKCNKGSISYTEGESYALPTPERRGYAFDGWYTRVTGGERITNNDPEIAKHDELYARWVKSEVKEREKKAQASMLKKQKRAIIVMVIAVILLGIGLGFVNYIVDIYRFEDINGDVYYIKKDDGIYALYNKGGDKCDKNSDGFYQTGIGTQLMIDDETGEILDTVYVDDIKYMHKDEIRGHSGRLLMFKQMTYDRFSTSDQSKIIKSIKVNNEFGGYTFIRDKNFDFIIEGREDLIYNKEIFALLSTTCGYTLSMDTLKNPVRLDNGSVDLSEYGLIAEERERVELDENGNEITVKYNYTPASYTITAMTGEYHTVTIGDKIVSGAGYYVMYSGGEAFDENGQMQTVEARERIYVLSSNGIENIVLRPIEALITPMIIYPMGQSSYFDVENFEVSTDINYEMIQKEFEALYADKTAGMTPEEVQKYIDSHPELQEKYVEIFNKYSKKICSFSYQDIEERTNSMYATLPYISHIEYTGGYYVNSLNIDTMLYKLASMEFIETVKLDPTEDDLRKYKLYESKYNIDFFYHDSESDTETETAYVYNTVYVSEKNADGTYYAYSRNFNMIVKVEAGYFEFLEWDDAKWYDSQYIQLDIGYITNILIESSKLNADIKFDNSGSQIATYLHGSGNTFTDSLKNKYSVEKNSDGKYWLYLDKTEQNAIFTGDYMLASVPYSKIAPANEHFIILENTQIDQNGDGTNDAIIHYGYNVIYKGGYYTLAATVALTDMQGNRIGSNSQVVGEVAYATEYFVTSKGQMFFASKSSYVGKILTERYSDTGHGAWHNGEVYVTADGKYILIDKNSGEWTRIDQFTCGVYFGDKSTSALSEHGIRIAPEYNAAGKLISPEEFYYSTGSHKIRYNYENGTVEKYNANSKSWVVASGADYTVGLWLHGSYFVAKSGEMVLVDDNNGDWGVIAPTKSNSQGAQIYINGEHLSYEFDSKTQSGTTVVRDQLYNFRQFYKGLLYASLEGSCDLTEEEMAALRELDDFASSDPDNPCMLKLTVLGRDLYGNERNVVYRFYKYTERRAYITIEVLGENGSDSEAAYGTFYVLGSFAQKIISDAQKLIDGVEINATSKY